MPPSGQARRPRFGNQIYDLSAADDGRDIDSIKLGARSEIYRADHPPQQCLNFIPDSALQQDISVSSWSTT